MSEPRREISAVTPNSKTSAGVEASCDDCPTWDKPPEPVFLGDIAFLHIMAVAANATGANMSAVSAWGRTGSLTSPQARLRQASGRSGRHDGGWTDAESPYMRTRRCCP